jgi:hypothetical protein
MFRRPLIAAACAVLALSLPAAAFADSAGDNQYQDPFSNVPSQPKQQNNQSSGTQGTTQPSAPTTTSAPAQSNSGTDPTAHADQLPRTGFPLLPVAALGAALLGAGLVLRRLA